MPDYSEILREYSSMVTEYQRVYSSGTEKLYRLQSEIQAIYERSGFSKLHNLLASDGFAEYQKQMQYLSKVYSSIMQTLVNQSSASLSKPTSTNEIPPDTHSPITTQDHSATSTANVLALSDIENLTIRQNHSYRSSQTLTLTNEESAIVPASIGKWFSISLLQKMHDDDFIAGETSASERYIEGIATEYGWPTTMGWLNTVYLDNYSNPEVLTGLMHCISHFDFDNVKPAGPTMALGVLQHEDYFVRDYAVRAFENWNDKEAIPILRALSCDAPWLQDYVNQVIASLETE